MKSIAIVAEDLSHPLDEGFKKASASIASAVAAAGITTAVFARRSSGLPIQTFDLPRNKLLWSDSFRRRLKTLCPDWILYMPQSSGTPMSLARARLIKAQSGGCPVAVLWLQRRQYPWPAGLVAKGLAPDIALVLSEAALADLKGLEFRVARVPLGVDTATFRPPGPGERERLRAKYGVGSGSEGRLVLHVGHISPRRNLALLKALVGRGARLLVVASTSTRRYPEVLRVLNQPSARVIDQYVAAIDEIYRLADCYVFPTFSDRGAIEIPLSVLEAMATNLPVVATSFGGLGDLFKEGGGLYLAASETEFPAKASEAMALETPRTRDMVTPFTWEHSAQAILAALEGAGV